MKTITIKQPWATLVCTPREDNPKIGIKDIENRTWATNYRGQVLVHASAKPWTFKALVNYLTKAMVEVLKTLGFNAEWVLKLPTGAIIGSVEVVDCVTMHESIWAEKFDGILDYTTKRWIEKPIYNWVLSNPIMFPEPIPAKGKLSFWDYPNIIAEAEEKGGPLFCHCQLQVKETIQVSGIPGLGFHCRYCHGRWYK